MTETYRDFELSYDPPPIPIREFDWCATHKQYDPTPMHSYDPPADGHLLLYAPTRELLIAEIEAWYAERAEWEDYRKAAQELMP